MDAEVPIEQQAGIWEPPCKRWAEDEGIGALEMGRCTAAESMLSSVQVLLLPALLTP